MIIKNKNELANSQMRSQALEIIEAGIESVLPSTVLHSALVFDSRIKSLSINDQTCREANRLFVIGGGKAGGAMAEAIEEIIEPECIEDGLVVDKADPQKFKTQKIQVVQAGHPIPDRRGLEAVRKILNLKNQYSISENDLILSLVSGGASALMPYPLEGISLEDKQAVTKLLLSSGASIDEINAVRKHLSAIKGGRLAQYFSPTRIVSLIISDVVSNDLSSIASGMTYPDSSTFQEAWDVLKKYGLLENTPPNVISVLKNGLQGKISETPKQLDNVLNYVLASNLTALEAMEKKAQGLGFNPVIVTDAQTGETQKVAEQLAREIMSGAFAGYDALLIGGETTPKLPETSGKGGRNQHLAALMPIYLDNYTKEWVLASVGTDGSDYLPDIAGAMVDQQTLAAYGQKQPNFAEMLRRFDSNTLLSTVGDSLIITGNTGTNVGDVILFLRVK